MSTPALRALAADEDRDALDGLAAILAELGHTVIARAVALAEVERVIAEEQPDLAIVKVHDDEEHALELIEGIVEGASCPVVALRETLDPGFAGEAAESGVFAYVAPVSRDSVHAGIEVARRRFVEVAQLEATVDQLETALGRRAVIERAKGMLMERHGLTEREAFELLRASARSMGRTVLDLGRDVCEGGAQIGEVVKGG